MGWTVIKEDENGNSIKSLNNELTLSDNEILYNSDFRILKYIDPYGNTTINQFMLPDLIEDLNELKKNLPKDEEQIEELIKLAINCQEGVHMYLKFYGD